MLRAKTRWKKSEVDPEQVDYLAKELSLHPTVARLLVQRGITDVEQAKRFLTPSLDHLHDPFLLDGMKEAVERIRQALKQKEKILIYGDYDADGVSSTSLMIKCFRTLGADVDYYIPNRFREGYGLNKEALEQARERGFQLVISVDTGISAVEEAEYAAELELDLIITDHHEPPAVLPQAIAVINPKKPNCPYPFKQLAGVGVAMKLVTALMGQVPTEWMDLVALGTIADLVPLIDENRVIATYGLKKMQLRNHIGLAALMDAAGIDQEVTAGHVGFFLGPRINASGRLDSANQAVELLLTEDPEEAKWIARQLNAMNQERQDLVEEITEEAAAMIENNPDAHRYVIVVAREGWNVGVVGIVASRLVEKYYRPVVVLSIDGKKGIAKGSARSIAGFDLYQALTECHAHLSHYGGHAMAAGMTLPVEKIDLFHQQLSQLAQSQLTDEDYIPCTLVEDEFAVPELSLDFIEQLKVLEPFGIGNPTPLFQISQATIAQIQRIGSKQAHMKLFLEKDGVTLEAVGFRCGDLADEMSLFAQAEVVGELTVNEWNGRRIPQLIIRDVCIKQRQIFDWRSNRKWEKLSELTGGNYLYVASLHSKWPSELRQKLQSRIVFWEHVRENWQERVRSYPYIVFVDLPPSMKLFQEGIRVLSHAERFYFLFGDRDYDEEMVMIPSREEFKRVYQLLYRAKDRQISFTRHLPLLSKKTGLSKRTLSFMIQVFEELSFLKREQDIIRINPKPDKKNLEDSSLFQRQKALSEVFQALIYSNYRELCSQIDRLGGISDGLQGKDSRHSRLSSTGN